jgi:hypothetical protein
MQKNFINSNKTGPANSFLPYLTPFGPYPFGGFRVIYRSVLCLDLFIVFFLVIYFLSSGARVEMVG